MSSLLKRTCSALCVLCVGHQEGVRTVTAGDELLMKVTDSNSYQLAFGQEQLSHSGLSFLPEIAITNVMFTKYPLSKVTGETCETASIFR